MISPFALDSDNDLFDVKSRDGYYETPRQTFKKYILYSNCMSNTFRNLFSFFACFLFSPRFVVVGFWNIRLAHINQMEWFTRPLLQKRMMCILKKTKQKRRSAMALINERQNCFRERERESGKKQKRMQNESVQF